MARHRIVQLLVTSDGGRVSQALLEHTTTLALPTLIWLNAHLGSLEFNRQPIVEMELFRIHAARILGWVTLPHYTAQTFGQDVELMLKQRWTFQEAHERLTVCRNRPINLRVEVPPMELLVHHCSVPERRLGNQGS